MTIDPHTKRFCNNKALVLLALASCVFVTIQDIFPSVSNHRCDAETVKMSDGSFADRHEKWLQKRDKDDEDRDTLSQICNRLVNGSYPQLGLPSIGTLWNSEITQIKQALLHSPANEPFGSRTSDLESLIERVTQALSLSHLRRSVRPATLSSNDVKLRRILDLLWERFRDPDNNPPLQVLVFGGPPKAGSNCERNGKFKKQGQCAWPGHFQDFANAYLGFDAIRVVNYAIGASSLQIATMMLRLRLFPTTMDPQGPDIIINAYAVNDFSYHSGENSKDGALSFLNLFGAFVDAVKDLTSCQQNRPFVIILDDFSVNYLTRHSIEMVESYRAEISKATNYHQVLTISYVDMIQDFLFSGSREEKLLVDWNGDSKHIPWGGHIGIVLALAYNALNILVDLCDQKLEGITTLEHGSAANERDQTLDSYFRPHLDAELALDDVGEKWSNRQAALVQKCNEGNKLIKKCPFAWIALRKEEEHRHMADISSILVENENWQYVQTWPPTNYGFFGSRNGTAVLHVQSSEDEDAVETITIMYMKSYSEKWYNSTVQATVRRCGEVVSSTELSGYHEKLTSEYFTETMTLSRGSSDCKSVDLTLDMTGGETFRIGGLSFC